MTPRERQIVEAFQRVTFLPGCSHKRFVRDMHTQMRRDPEKALTPKQAEHLVRLAWRYRRQMPANLAYPLLEGETA